MKILFAVVCFILWNFADFALGKNESDEKHLAFPFRQYASEKWDDWLGSLICCAALLLTMKLGFGVDILKNIDVGNLVWSDSLIGASGPAWQAVPLLVRKLKALAK